MVEFFHFVSVISVTLSTGTLVWRREGGTVALDPASPVLPFDTHLGSQPALTLASSAKGNMPYFSA